MIASDDFLLPQADAAGACFTPSAVASFAPFFAGGALPLPDDSEDAGADGLVGVGTHAVAVALRAWQRRYTRYHKRDKWNVSERGIIL